MLLFRSIRHLPTRKIVFTVSLFVVTLLYAVAQYTPTVAALSTDQKLVFQSGINYYDTQVCGGGGPVSGTGIINVDTSGNTTGPDKAVQAVVWNTLMEGGVDATHTAAIMGNIAIEGVWDPTNIEDPAGTTKDRSTIQNLTGQTQGYGLIGWTPGNSLLAQMGILGMGSDKPYTAETQAAVILAGVLGKLPSYWSADLGKQFLNTTSIGDAVAAYEGNQQYGGPYYGFERPGDEQATYAKRVNKAKYFLQKFSGPSIPDPTDGSGGGSSECCSSGSSTLDTNINDVYVLGDSITDASQGAYRQAFKPYNTQLNIDASDGRGINTPGTTGNKLSGIQAINQDTSQIQQADAVVVALGTYGGASTQDIDTVTNAIQNINPGASIYWVNVTSFGRSDNFNQTTTGPTNQALSQQSRSDGYQIVNWFKAVDPDGDPANPTKSEKNPNHYIDPSGNGLLPTDQGGQALANLVLKATGADQNTTGGGGGGDCCGTSVSGPSEGGPLLGIPFPQLADTSALADNINKYIQSNVPSSPLANLGDEFVTAGQKFNVNPALMVAIASKESTIGTNQPDGSHDAWGLTAEGDVSGYRFENGIYYFPSWIIGINEASKYVGDNYSQPGDPLYSTSIEQLMTHYTPGSVAQQTQITLDVMQAIVNGLQGGTTGSSGSGPSSPSTPSASATTTGDDASCGGTTTGSGGWTNPFPDGWTPGRLDMGYDGTFTGRVVSPCDGTMSYVYADDAHDANGGWEGAYFVVKCSQSITVDGNTTNGVYFAEGIYPTVSQGDTVTAGQQIGKQGWTGYSEGPGGIEWGLTSGTPQETLAASLGNSCVVGSASQKMVMAFSQWFQQTLRVAPPATTDHAGCA